MARTVEEIVADAKKQGFRLAGLYERRTYPASPLTPVQFLGYRAAFATPGEWRVEDEGQTMAEALEETLLRARGEKGKENRPLTTQSVAAEAPEMDDLI